MLRQITCLLLLCGTGCTTLKIKPVTDNDPQSHAGLPYALQMTTYKIEITRKVVKCGKTPEILVTAKIGGAEQREDSSRRYTIDPDSLSSLFKTGSVKLGYDPNGTVTTFNAKAEDRTAQIIANVAGIAAKIATFAAAGGGVNDTEACTEAVLKALSDLPAQQKALKAKTAIVEARTGELKAVQAKVTSMGDAVDSRTKQRLSNAIDALTAAVDTQQEAAEALAKTMKAVSIVKAVYWPVNTAVAPGKFTLPLSELRRFVSIDTNPGVFNPDSMTVFAELSPLNTITYNYGAAETVDAGLGIPFRRPVPGKLTVCGDKPCASGGSILAELEAPVLQFGETYYLPCVSRPFTSVECNFELTADGKLKSIGSAQTSAPLEGATTAAGSVVDSAINIRTTLNGKDTARLQAKTAASKAEADYNAAVASLAANPNASTLAATAALKADTDLTLAKIAQIQADAALQAALATQP